MQMTEDRALITQIQDRLVELYVDRQALKEVNDWRRIRLVEAEINKLTVELEQIRAWEPVGTA